MPILHAIVLGILQGLTEFFPISSSGHLVIAPWLFGWDDFAGNEDLAKTFDVALHLGTLVGVVAYTWNDLVGYVRAGVIQLFERRSPMPTNARIAYLLIVASVPAGITGIALNDLINQLDDVLWLVAVMLVVGGVALYWADQQGGKRVVKDWDLRGSLIMGVAQAIALQPGVSRSGVTMTAARAIGYDRGAAARLSFLMSVPIIAGAVLFSFGDSFAAGGIPSDFVAPFVVGIASSAITGWLAVWATLRIVTTRTFTPFVIYRFALAGLIFALLASGIR